jgi:hypothetical protein
MVDRSSKPPHGRPSETPTSSTSRARVVTRTKTFALGVYDDIVIMALFAGAADDPRHVTEAADLVKAQHERLGRPLRLLALMHATLRPPSAGVRDAFARVIPGTSSLLSRLALVVIGEGFEAAIHRGAATGFRLMVRAKMDTSIHSTLPEALGKLLAANEPREPLIQFCERELAE